MNRERLVEAVRLREEGRAKQDLDILEKAREMLLELATESPNEPEITYQLGICHDNMGRGDEAIPLYRQALEQGLSGPERARCMLGLGSTLRYKGRYEEALLVLLQGTEEFPEHRGLQAFLAMALYNTGNSKPAIELLFAMLLETTSDETLQYFRRGLEYYAQHLDETW